MNRENGSLEGCCLWRVGEGYVGLVDLDILDIQSPLAGLAGNVG